MFIINKSLFGTPMHLQCGQFLMKSMRSKSNENLNKLTHNELLIQIIILYKQISCEYNYHLNK